MNDMLLPLLLLIMMLLMNAPTDTDTDTANCSNGAYPKLMKIIAIFHRLDVYVGLDGRDS